MAEKGGFTLKQTAISPEAMEMYDNSPWMACTADVGAGAMDPCIGTFWETPSKRQLSSFSSPLWVNLFYLVVKTRSEIFGEKVVKVFAPFSPELWVLILVVLLAVGLLFWLFEADSNEDEDDLEDEDVRKVRST